MPLLHEHHQQPCWLHTATRVISWTQPYVLAELASAAEHEPPSEAVPNALLLQAFKAKQIEDWKSMRFAEEHSEILQHPLDNRRSQQRRHQEDTPKDPLERELKQRPQVTCSEFLARGGGRRRK